MEFSLPFKVKRFSKGLWLERDNLFGDFPQRFFSHLWEFYLKNHQRGKLSRVKLPQGRTVALKVYRRGGWLGKWGSAYYLSPQKLFSEISCYLFLEDKGFPLPLVLGGAVVYRGFFSHLFLFTECWEDGKNPLELWQEGEWRKKRREHLVQMASTIRCLHDKGVWHGDLNLRNLLYSPSKKLWSVVDFSPAECFSSSLPEEKRWDNLLRLYRSMRKLAFLGEFPLLSSYELALFFRTYWGEEKPLRVGWEKIRRFERKLTIRKFFWKGGKPWVKWPF